PPSKQGTIIFPGYDGGAEWSGPAYDPETGIIYINANEMPWILTIVDSKNEAPPVENNLQAGQRLYKAVCMSCHGANLEGSGNNPTLITINKKYSAQQLVELITTGRRMMPAL